MKRHSRFFVNLIIVICIFSLSVIGCEKYKGEMDKTKTEAVQARTVVVYFIDGKTAAVTEKSAVIRNEYDIWSALKESGLLTEECELLSLKVDEVEKKLDLDFNVETGEWIRSMGTAGETEIIGCIINTYLEAYRCERICLTQEGQAFETSHGAEFDGYSGKMTF